MIEVECYKAFYGTMLITPKNPQFEPFELTCDWLYKPEYDCWYGDGRSFVAGVCQIVKDFTRGAKSEKGRWVPDMEDGYQNWEEFWGPIFRCSICGSREMGMNEDNCDTPFCHHCGNPMEAYKNGADSD